MKKEPKKASEISTRTQQPKRRSETPSMTSKTIRTNSGKVVRQYPAEVGYHGSGDETKLNPEE